MKPTNEMIEAAARTLAGFHYSEDSVDNVWQAFREEAKLVLTAAETAMSDNSSFQSRVQPWMTACFGPEISADRLERNDRFIEEALELVQASNYPKARALALVDYVYGRDQGDINQEVGGVMVTLAAHCLAHGVDMHDAAETELARIWTKVEAIRAKQASKPTGSALPVAARPSHTGDKVEPVAWEGYWSGAGSINSQTALTNRKTKALEWERNGAEITPLYSAATLAALVAERDEIAQRAAVIDEALTNAIHMRRQAEAERDAQYAENVERIAKEGEAILRAEAAESALATANARVARLEKAMRRAHSMLTYPVSTEINPRGYGWRPEPDMEFAIETICAALMGGENAKQ